MKTGNKMLYWTPRIICIIAILFVSLFALDSFGPNMTFWQQIGAFIIHLIPSFVLLAVLIVAWKWELLGGLIFILIGLGLSPFIFNHNYQMNHSVAQSLNVVLVMNIPFVLVGVLFIIHHFRKRKLIPEKD